jgi:ABC-2 type transport system ATP-binding protein
MISVCDLVFEYPGRRALHGVSLEVAPGGITALVGPNGAGKTTLLRCIAGLQTPVAGSVFIGGVDAIRSRRECHRLLGYLSDFFGVYDRLTVRQCLEYMAMAHGLRGSDVARAVARTSERVAITGYLEARAGTLSRGLRQRLALGQAVVHDPQFLLLDEPASGLDPEARRGLSLLLTRLQEAGTTLIVSSHLLSELEDYCTDILILDRGRVVHQRSVRRQDTRVRAYVLDVVGDKPTALRKLEATPGVGQPRIEGDRLVFESDRDRAFLAEILSSLVKDGMAVAAFHEYREDMQELYFSALSGTRRAHDES